MDSYAEIPGSKPAVGPLDFSLPRSFLLQPTVRSVVSCPETCSALKKKYGESNANIFDNAMLNHLKSISSKYRLN